MYKMLLSKLRRLLFERQRKKVKIDSVIGYPSCFSSVEEFAEAYENFILERNANPERYRNPTKVFYRNANGELEYYEDASIQIIREEDKPFEKMFG